MTDKLLQQAMIDLLQAMDVEDRVREDCAGIGGAALFLALDNLTEATEHRKKCALKVSRLLTIIVRDQE